MKLPLGLLMALTMTAVCAEPLPPLGELYLIRVARVTSATDRGSDYTKQVYEIMKRNNGSHLKPVVILPPPSLQLEQSRLDFTSPTTATITKLSPIKYVFKVEYRIGRNGPIVTRYYPEDKPLVIPATR